MQLGGGGDEEEEGVTVPGDDDQLSYVSAPASDYSVTTVGSDVLNNSRLSDEEERRSKPETKVIYIFETCFYFIVFVKLYYADEDVCALKRIVVSQMFQHTV